MLTPSTNTRALSGKTSNTLRGFFGVLVVTRDHHNGIAFFDIELGFESVAHLFYFKRMTQFILD